MFCPIKIVMAEAMKRNAERFDQRSERLVVGNDGFDLGRQLA